MLTYVVVYWPVHIFRLFSFADKKPFHHIKSERTQKHLSEGKAVKQSPVRRQKARKTMLVLLSSLEAAAAKLWWTETQFLCFPCQCAVLKPFIMLRLSGGSQGKLYQPSHDSGSAMETCCEGSPLKDSIAHTHTLTLTNLHTLENSRTLTAWVRNLNIISQGHFKMYS